MGSGRARRVVGAACVMVVSLIARVGASRAHIVYYVADVGFHAISRDGAARRSLVGALHPELQAPIAFSPDGRWIVFEYEPPEPVDAMGDICVVNADGSGWRNLTNRVDWDTGPGWSPDGARIVFASHAGPQRELYTMRPDGSDKAMLPQAANPTGTARWPAYSPDGTQLAFAATGAGGGKGGNISITDTDGANVREIQSDLNAMMPSWSPDGSRIAFVADREGDNHSPDIYTMRPDGTGVHRLTRHPSWDVHASWSPGGSEIAFLSGRDDGQPYRLYVVDAATGRVTRVSDRDVVHAKPTWAPAGALDVSDGMRRLTTWGWLRAGRGL